MYKIVVEIPQGQGGYFSGQKLEIPGREGGLSEIPSMVVVWIFSGTTQWKVPSKSMMFKIMVHISNSCICSLSSIAGFINQVVYLLRDRLAYYSKNCTFTRHLEVNWSRLHRITWNIYLLCKIK